LLVDVLIVGEETWQQLVEIRKFTTKVRSLKSI